MAFTSVDDLVSEIAAGKIHRSDWQYRTNIASGSTASASIGINLSSYPGQFGTPNAFPGTALNWVTCDDAAGNGTQIFGIPHGGNVSPDKKHLISASAFAQAGLPATGGTLVLVDLQGYWPGVSHTTTAVQTLTGTPSLRYANGDGCRLFTVTTTLLGATTHNITINYTNQANNNANTGLIAARISSVVGQISSCFPGAAPSLYFPLVNGDTGVQNVANVRMSAASTAGVSALCLARPLAAVPLVAAVYNLNEKEFVYQTPSMPEIKDGACLVWLYFSATGASSSTIAAATGFTGHIETAWG
jgi:hypothetical protein